MTSTFESASGSAAAVLGAVPLFAGLSVSELEELSLAAIPFEAEAGETLLEQGAPAEDLYLIHGGTVGISVRLPGGAWADLGTVGAGEVLGEMGLLDDAPPSATARTLERTAGFRIPRRAFQVLWAAYRPGACKVIRRLIGLLSDRLRTTTGLLADAEVDEAAPPVPGLAKPESLEEGASPIERRRPSDPVEHLRLLPIFRDYPPKELETLLSSLHELRVPRGHVVFREGDPPGSCFVVVRGAIQVSVERSGMIRKVAILGPGSMFGELALFHSCPRSGTCLARERSTLLELEAPTFERLFKAESVTAFRFMTAASRLLTHSLRRADRRHAWLVARSRLRAAQEQP